MLRLEELERREVPRVSIAFDFDPSFPVAPRAAVVEAGRVFGENLYPPAGPNEVRVAVSQRELSGRLAEGGYGAIAFATNAAWFDGVTECGLTPYRVDRFTITLHELGHVFGVGTVVDWSKGSVARDVPISADGVHFAGSVDGVFSDAAGQFGRRKLLTAVDLAALSDLGWNAGAPVGLGGPVCVSVADGRGACRLYVVTERGLVATPFVSSLLVVVDDYNYDGVADVRVRTPSGGAGGFDAIVNGRDGSILAAESYPFATSVLTGRLP